MPAASVIEYVHVLARRNLKQGGGLRSKHSCVFIAFS